MIYWDFRKWIYLDIRNPFKTMKKLKGVFKPLKCYFRGNLHSDWFPMLWCSKPAFIHIMSVDVGWKDKYDTPRYEYPPAIWIHLFGINLIWYWDVKRNGYTDDYWEQALWYLHYYHTYSQGLLDKPNIEKAKEAWPWEDFYTKKSSWNDNFLVNGRN